jgi:NitT/TauT family transport system ATP-binding protein
MEGSFESEGIPRLQTENRVQVVEDVSLHPEASVRIDNLYKAYDKRGRQTIALSGIDLDIGSSEFVAIVGPSGCGKSTLLRILAGLEGCSFGQVRWGGVNKGVARSAVVFQGDSIFPWMTVERNIEYGLRMLKVPKAERMARTDRYLKLAGLEGFERAYPHELSGGMRQRVAIARAFAVDAGMLLMDEPFAALDEQNKLILQQELLTIWEGSRKAVVFITHSIDEALILADRVVVMTARPGRIKSETIVPFERPRNVVALRADSQYGRLYKQLWESLQDEVRSERA